ncbi:hypothetical protein DdX_03322 [Ditylenchus destructor]|uniref:Uncharacterized protein n=1 Tax=Ditylenchus destructor TaxID=166010 RepID=A0AAD4R9X3_9BILA|nr:hypothetical protein DdX_03322 [Ditylenchus destructor]
MVTLNYYVSGWAAAGSGFGQIAIGGGSGRQPLRSSDVSLLWGAGNICSFVGPSVPAVKCYYLGCKELILTKDGPFGLSDAFRLRNPG